MNGHYTFTIETPLGRENGHLDLQQRETHLTANLRLNGRTETLQGTTTGEDRFAFQGKRKWLFRTIDYTIQGEVSGDRLQGTLKSSLGVMPFTGIRTR